MEKKKELLQQSKQKPPEKSGAEKKEISKSSSPSSPSSSPLSQINPVFTLPAFHVDTLLCKTLDEYFARVNFQNVQLLHLVVNNPAALTNLWEDNGVLLPYDQACLYNLGKCGGKRYRRFACAACQFFVRLLENPSGFQEEEQRRKSQRSSPNGQSSPRMGLGREQHSPRSPHSPHLSRLERRSMGSITGQVSRLSPFLLDGEKGSENVANEGETSQKTQLNVPSFALRETKLVFPVIPPAFQLPESVTTTLTKTSAPVPPVTGVAKSGAKKGKLVTKDEKANKKKEEEATAKKTQSSPPANETSSSPPKLNSSPPGNSVSPPEEKASFLGNLFSRRGEKKGKTNSVTPSLPSKPLVMPQIPVSFGYLLPDSKNLAAYSPRLKTVLTAEKATVLATSPRNLTPVLAGNGKDNDPQEFTREVDYFWDQDNPIIKFTGEYGFLDEQECEIVREDLPFGSFFRESSQRKVWANRFWQQNYPGLNNPNLMYYVADGFTLNFLISFILQHFLTQESNGSNSSNSSSVGGGGNNANISHQFQNQIHAPLTIFRCRNEGFTFQIVLNYYNIAEYDFNPEQGQEIFLQLAQLFLVLKKYQFLHGNPSVKSLVVEQLDEAGNFALKLRNFQMSSLQPTVAVVAVVVSPEMKFSSVLPSPSTLSSSSAFTGQENVARIVPNRVNRALSHSFVLSDLGITFLPVQQQIINSQTGTSEIVTVLDVEESPYILNAAGITLLQQYQQAGLYLHPSFEYYAFILQILSYRHLYKLIVENPVSLALFTAMWGSEAEFRKVQERITTLHQHKQGAYTISTSQLAGITLFPDVCERIVQKAAGGLHKK